MEPTKSILVVSTYKLLLEEAFFRGYSLKIVTGSRYIGGFVGMKAIQVRWLEEKVEVWRASVAIMSGVAGNHLQTTYVGLQKSLQQEWALVQHFTPDIWTAFQPMEDALCKKFPMALFKGAT